MINWITFDPENPPEDGIYFASNGEWVEKCEYRKANGFWTKGEYGVDVTHYAEINLPGDAP
ncbi:hypothetical protein BK138_16185 [Paenibacillus rhizosphaerae]|uniref:DUF551 domain-containing protein n=1 Tax=Paenibacillus rhizosphaerae TaxID=297318 RepID=A0A1R1ESA6_9BACL|nr:hypothetical protein [Paenibacillus rhizosphaerae]OMF54695.1 hypothetical protein BK138_16185 [Paenibacillus rhizosphaerae]